MSNPPSARHDRRTTALADRRAERARRRPSASSGSGTVRTVAFGGVIVGVLAIGAFLAFGDFFNRPADVKGVINVQSSMAGFTPSTITVEAGATVTLDWWTNDAAIHLRDGVHTMVSPELGLYEELPAESSRTIAWTVPNRPGTYDVWCDSCCGGRESPTMHGTIVVKPADSAGEAAPAAA